MFGRNAHFLPRADFIEKLEDMGLDDIVSMWKEESPFDCYVTFHSAESAGKLKEMSPFKIGETHCVVSDSEDEVNDVRVHWTPAAMTKKPLERYFLSKDFTVIEYEMEKNKMDSIGNGVRRFRLLGKKEAWKSLPHLCVWEQSSTTLLFVIPGREPLCLKCRNYGHHRNQCPTNQKKTQKPGQPKTNRRWETVPPSKNLQAKPPLAVKPKLSLQSLGKVNPQTDRKKVLQEVREHLKKAGPDTSNTREEEETEEDRNQNLIIDTDTNTDTDEGGSREPSRKKSKTNISVEEDGEHAQPFFTPDTSSAAVSGEQPPMEEEESLEALNQLFSDTQASLKKLGKRSRAKNK
ncbi:hypothetical protein ACOMHN_037219 [Nucella lapillus]